MGRVCDKEEGRKGEWMEGGVISLEGEPVHSASKRRRRIDPITLGSLV